MDPLIVAHRGFSGQFPENTMIAFEKAYGYGADGVELDVQLTKDKEVVIFHDFTLERVTDGRGEVSQYTLGELKQKSIKNHFQTGIETQTILTLKEYLDWVRDKKFITNIELKAVDDKEDGLEQKVSKLIQHYGVKENTLVSSFHFNRVKRMKVCDSELKTGLLIKECNGEIIKMAKHNGMDSIHPHFGNLTNEIMIHANKQELKINTWTVNSVVDLSRVNSWPVNSIITNFPDRLGAIQRSHSQKEVS